VMMGRGRGLSNETSHLNISIKICVSSVFINNRHFENTNKIIQ
jgi:hypothetical protein